MSPKPGAKKSKGEHLDSDYDFFDKLPNEINYGLLVGRNNAGKTCSHISLENFHNERGTRTSGVGVNSKNSGGTKEIMKKRISDKMFLVDTPGINWGDEKKSVKYKKLFKDLFSGIVKDFFDMYENDGKTLVEGIPDDKIDKTKKCKVVIYVLSHKSAKKAPEEIMKDIKFLVEIQREVRKEGSNFYIMVLITHSKKNGFLKCANWVKTKMDMLDRKIDGGVFSIENYTDDYIEWENPSYTKQLRIVIAQLYKLFYEHNFSD